MNAESGYALATGIGCVLCLAVLVPIGLLGRRMRAQGGPGILSFELAESTLEANRYLRAWGPSGRAAASSSLWWRLGLVVCYVAALGAGGRYLALRADRVHYGWLAVAETVAAVLVAGAGALDVVGSATLLAQLRVVRASTGLVRLSHLSAQVKYLAVGVAGVGLLVGLGILQLAG